MERVQVIVRKSPQPRAGTHDARDHAGVDQTICEHDIATFGQHPKHGGVRGETGVPDEAVLVTVPAGECAFEFGVKFGVAGDERRRAGGGAPNLRGFGGGCHHGGVLGEAEVVVVGEVEPWSRHRARGELAPQAIVVALL